MLWLLLFLVFIAYLIYSYYKYATYWKKSRVSSIWPWPLFGNTKEVIFQQRSIAYVTQKLYNSFPGKRYIGMYHATDIVLMIRDPDLIKKILVKEFETFPQHKSIIPEGSDYLWNKNLFAMEGGKKWQDVRSTLSPSFTSSKMKMMFNLIKDCSTKFVEHFSESGETVTIELKDNFTKYTNDVIATTAFGVQINSLENPKNEFYHHGSKITSFGGWQHFKLMLFIIIPNFMKILGVPLFSQSSKDFLVNVIKSTIAIRKEKSIVRPDMVHLLMEASKGNIDENDVDRVDSGFAAVNESIKATEKNRKTFLSDEDIVAQAFIFFFAGFETSSAMLCQTIYELALNPDIQNRLRTEVDEVLNKCNGDITYEELMKMKYLDMVISESLRKWPPALTNDREAKRPFVFESERPDETTLKIDVGQLIIIPTYALHRDPKYFPDPEKFDPERFSDKNKHNIKPFSYIPFGAGPRNCIGSRFALLEGKLIIFEILKKFELIPVEKTEIPLKLGGKSLLPVPDNGFWLGFKPRNN